MRVILCGFGRMGEAHGLHHRQHQQVRVVAVVDPSAARRARARRLFPDALVVPSETEVTVSADTADVCSPPGCHAAQTRHFLTRRVSVLCEKPAVLDPATGVGLADLATRVQRTLHPVHNYLHSPSFRLVRRTIDRATIGGVRRVRVCVARTHPAFGTPGWYPAWRSDPTVAGGGILLDHGTHWIYVLLHLFGPVTGVRCALRMRGEVEHRARLELAFSRGIRAGVVLNWLSSRRRTTVVVSGTTGSLTIGDRRASLRTAGADSPLVLGELDEVDDPHTHDAWFPGVFEEYERLHAERRGPTREWSRAIETAKVVRLAQESHVRGRIWLPFVEP